MYVGLISMSSTTTVNPYINMKAYPQVNREPEPYEHIDDFFIFDYRSVLDQVPKRFPNSCSWILGADEFSRWSMREGSNVFWLHGYPGQGKSVIARYLVEEVLPNADRGFPPTDIEPYEKPIIVYFFCSYQNGVARTIQGLLCSFIHQLLAQLCSQGKDVKSTMRQRHKMLSLPPKDAFHHIWSIFLDLSIIAGKRLCLVLDALDELDRADRVIFLGRFVHIVNLRAQEARKPRFIITSRNDPIIAEHMKAIGAWALSLDNAKGKDADLEDCIKKTVVAYGD